MEQHPLQVVTSRRDGLDVLVEASPGSSPGPGATSAGEGVALVCGSCGRVLWRRSRQASGESATDASPTTAGRVLIECPGCHALNVLPTASAA